MLIVDDQQRNNELGDGLDFGPEDGGQEKTQAESTGPIYSDAA